MLHNKLTAIFRSICARKPTTEDALEATFYPVKLRRSTSYPGTDMAKGNKKPRSKFSRDIVNNMTLLKLLAKAKPSIQKRILEECDASLTKAICECSQNVISGRVPLSTRHFKKLKPYAAHLRRLTDKATPLSGKRRIIKQHGGFLATLLSALLPILIGGVSSAFQKH